MSEKSADPQSQAFQNYIQDKKIVVCDPSGVARGTMANILSKMGAKGGNIALAQDFAEAERLIENLKPTVVICDYDLGKRCGLELIQKQRSHHPEARDRIFILVTGNTSQTAVARAAEEDVDTYVLKPFTAKILRDSIIKVAVSKASPSEYIRTIEKGKARLTEGLIQAAIDEFEKATKLDPAPSLACFYLGQANLLKEALGIAEGSYQQGLNYNKIHYKCLVGLYEILMSQNRFEEAYEVVKKIAQWFPANPQRLVSVLKLAILTKNVDDVEKYYQIFTKIDERNEEVIKHVCAALVVTGKYYLSQNLKSRALELFGKAAVTAAGRSKVLREMIVSLVEAGHAKEAHDILKRFPAGNQKSSVYLAMQFIVAAETTDTPGRAIEKGRKLITEGIQDPAVYLCLIRKAHQAGVEQAAEHFHDEGVKRWPELKDAFAKALSGRTAKAA